MRYAIAALLVLLLQARPASAEEATIPTLAMTDQFANKYDVADYRGDVVVLVFADKGGAEASRKEGTRLHVHFHPEAKDQKPPKSFAAPVAPLPGLPVGVRSPDAKIVPIAVIGDVPGALHLMVRARFRAAIPDAPVWIDMTDAMRKQFVVEKDVPNFAVLDAEGRVRYTTSGALDEVAFNQLANVVQALRYEAARR
jgi:hypothetical protein